MDTLQISQSLYPNDWTEELFQHCEDDDGEIYNHFDKVIYGEFWGVYVSLL